MNGAAGFAYTLLRMASIREDDQLLGLADLWSTAAVRSIGRDDAFYNAEIELTPDTVGVRSFYHHEPGVHCVQVLVSGARGDYLAQRRAVDAFVRAASVPCPDLDVAFGRAGLLIACAQLLEALPPEIDPADITSLGDSLTASIETELEHEPAMIDSREHTKLGAAHGWAGYLYALLRWNAATGSKPSPSIAGRLEQLLALGHARGRAMYWPMDTRAPVIEAPLAASWCNGSAGYVPLWTLAHTVLGDERYARLAMAAAWGAYDGHAAAPGDICCGLAGRAYALASMYCHGGDPVWLTRARLLAGRAAERILDDAHRPYSLYKGKVGVALLADEITAPGPAGLPLFAPEGWPLPAT
jgi:serine/threonine-protein kinase